MPHRIRAAGREVPITLSCEYDDPEFKPNQEQKQATGSSNTWVDGPATPGPARLRLRALVSASTPQGCEDAIEEWTALFRTADRFYDEFSTRYLVIAGLPTLGFDRRKGRTTKHVTADWPLLNPYWQQDDADGNVIAGSTRLSP